jgi:hypothetical protein
MNKWDRDNLNFILSLDERGFDEWYATLDQDDLDYAMELLKQARTEVGMQMAAVFDDTTDMEAACEVLSKFTLSKKVTVK